MSYWSDITNQSRQRQLRNYNRSKETGSKSSKATPTSPRAQSPDYPFWHNTTNNPYRWNQPVDESAGDGEDAGEILGDAGGGGYGGYGGYGGGRPAVNMDSVRRLLSQQPTQYTAMRVPEYSAPEFYEFDGAAYDQARKALATGLDTDRVAGQAAYADARTELGALASNPYARQGARQPATADPSTSALLARYGGEVDTSGAAAGNAAFEQLRSILGAAHAQRQAAETRAVGGDERRYLESLAGEGRMISHGIEVAEARAREQHRINEFQYGKQVADQIYQQQMAQAQADHAAASANVDLANQQQSAATQTLLNLISGGQAVDAATIDSILGGA